MEQTGKTLGDSLQLQGTHGETQESEHETKDSFTHTHTHTKKKKKKKKKMGAECSIVRMVGLKEGVRRIGRPLDGWLKKCTVRNKEVNGSGG
jgi:hypothetical protein